jgi:hypothetical protein
MNFFCCIVQMQPLCEAPVGETAQRAADGSELDALGQRRGRGSVAVPLAGETQSAPRQNAPPSSLPLALRLLAHWLYVAVRVGLHGCVGSMEMVVRWRREQSVTVGGRDSRLGCSGQTWPDLAHLSSSLHFCRCRPVGRANASPTLFSFRYRLFLLFPASSASPSPLA